MTDITLRLLQERRGAALDAMDWPAYWAFDIMIAHVIGAVDMYQPVNAGVTAAREDSMRRFMDEQRAEAEREQRMVAAYVAEGLGEI